MTKSAKVLTVWSIWLHVKAQTDKLLSRLLRRGLWATIHCCPNWCLMSYLFWSSVTIRILWRSLRCSRIVITFTLQQNFCRVASSLIELSMSSNLVRTMQHMLFSRFFEQSTFCTVKILHIEIWSQRIFFWFQKTTTTLPLKWLILASHAFMILTSVSKSN